MAARMDGRSIRLNGIKKLRLARPFWTVVWKRKALQIRSEKNRTQPRLNDPPEPQAPWTAAGFLPLSGGRLPAGSLALRCPMLNRYRVGCADWFEARLSDFAPAGLAGKSGSRAAAVQGADAPSRAVGSLDCGRRPAAFWRQASCRVTRFTLPNAEPLSRWLC